MNEQMATLRDQLIALDHDADPTPLIARYQTTIETHIKHSTLVGGDIAHFVYAAEVLHERATQHLSREGAMWSASQEARVSFNQNAIAVRPTKQSRSQPVLFLGTRSNSRLATRCKCDSCLASNEQLRTCRARGSSHVCAPKSANAAIARHAAQRAGGDCAEQLSGSSVDSMESASAGSSR